MTSGARSKYKTGLVNTYSVSAGPVQFNATSRSHKHKNMADYQRNMLLSVLMNEIDSSLDTGKGRGNHRRPQSETGLAVTDRSREN